MDNDDNLNRIMMITDGCICRLVEIIFIIIINHQHINVDEQLLENIYIHR